MYLNTELKMNGKNAFRKNFWPCVAVAFLVELLTGGGSGVSVVDNISNLSDIYDMDSSGSFADAISLTSAIPFGIGAMAVGIIVLIGVLVILFGFFIGNVLEVGGDRFFIQNRTSMPTAGTILEGFKSGNYKNIVKTLFFRDLFIFLWTLLLIVPGIVKSFEYLMVPYIIAENPGMDRKEAFALSKQMMDGEKMNAFVLGLSFIGWYILAVFTCGILNIFYVSPYVQATYAELYAYNKEKAFRQGWIH